MKKKGCKLISWIFLMSHIALITGYIIPFPGIVPIGIESFLRTYIDVFSFFTIIIIFISNFYLFVLKLKTAIVYLSIGIFLQVIVIGFILIYSTINSIDLRTATINIIIYFANIFYLLAVNIILIYKRFKPSIDGILMIRKTILDYGTQHTRLEVKEISEKIKLDKDTIIYVIKDMINNEEVFADYFPISKSIVFNQLANINEVDKLMQKFEEWKTVNLQENKESRE